MSDPESMPGYARDPETRQEATGDPYTPEHLSEYVKRFACVKLAFDDYWHVVKEDRPGETLCGLTKDEASDWLVRVKYERLKPYIVDWRICVSCAFKVDELLTRVVQERHAYEARQRVNVEGAAEGVFIEKAGETRRVIARDGDTLQTTAEYRSLEFSGDQAVAKREFREDISRPKPPNHWITEEGDAVAEYGAFEVDERGKLRRDPEAVRHEQALGAIADIERAKQEIERLRGKLQGQKEDVSAELKRLTEQRKEDERTKGYIPAPFTTKSGSPDV